MLAGLMSRCRIPQRAPRPEPSATPVSNSTIWRQERFSARAQSERAAVHELRDQVLAAFEFARVEDGEDVRVVQR